MPPELLSLISSGEVGVGFVGLILVVLSFFFGKRRNGNGQKEIMEDLRDNHLHNIANTLERIDRKLDKLNDGIIWIRSKLNGK